MAPCGVISQTVRMWKGGIGAFTNRECRATVVAALLSPKTVLCRPQLARNCRLTVIVGGTTPQPRPATYHVTVWNGPHRTVGIVALHPKPSTAGHSARPIAKATQINLRGVTVAGGAADRPRYRVSGSQNERREKISRRHTLSKVKVVLAPLLMPT